MTPNLPDIDPDLLRGELARRSLKAFIQLFWSVIEPTSPFVDGLHIDALCTHLEHAWQLGRLIINCPRRHTKSLISSVFFPAWTWTQDPSVRFLCCSYALDLSRDLAIKCRSIVQSELYRKCYKIILTEDQNTILKFTNSARGYRQACSVESGTVGSGADCIIFDDPDNLQQISSEIEREKTNRFWRATLSQCINNPRRAFRAIIQQRCHPDDLSGWLLENEPDLWTHLCLPFEFNPDRTKETPLWRDTRTEHGQPLSNLLPEKEIKAKKRDVITWETQFNQHPILHSDQSFFVKDWFAYFTEEETSFLVKGKRYAKEECPTFATCDPSAYASGGRGDYTAVGVFAVTPGCDLLLLHMTRRRMETTAIVPELERLFHQYRLSFVGIEDVAFQRSLIQHAKAVGLPVRPVKPHVKKERGETAKEARAYDLQTRMANGQVFFRPGANWLPDLELELLEFPHGKHDDQTDCLSYAAMQVSKMRGHYEEPKPAPTVDEQKAAQAKAYRAALHQGLR